MCLYYHSHSEKRRVYKYFPYSSTLCPQVYECSNSDKCENAHTLNEILYHPSLYRSEMCNYPKINNVCIFDKICPFFHESKDQDQIFNEYMEAHQSLDQLSKEMANIEEEIKEKSKIEDQLSKKFKCKCGGNKEFVRVPCGHGSCQPCSLISQCPVCLIETKTYKISFV